MYEHLFDSSSSPTYEDWLQNGGLLIPSISEYDICIICRDVPNDPVQTSKCKHVFCSDCCFEWFKRGNSRQRLFHHASYSGKPVQEYIVKLTVLLMLVALPLETIGMCNVKNHPAYGLVCLGGWVWHYGSLAYATEMRKHFETEWWKWLEGLDSWVEDEGIGDGIQALDLFVAATWLVYQAVVFERMLEEWVDPDMLWKGVVWLAADVVSYVGRLGELGSVCRRFFHERRGWPEDSITDDPKQSQHERHNVVRKRYALVVQLFCGRSLGSMIHAWFE
ncbi:uncharacterized protein LTR77_000848 [Saxophila tyrrhenica]|uniref:Zinc finger C3HC4 RING-type domain-containing protein n=1 Tax=Saxophila tyrrhenica TaxID=1690608 RepID=A0AAV9PP70_9PEZI|nr:hypothetical protein LTR77_000848 [Saxophila tyrrhenica]